MRKIEKQMLKAIIARKDWSEGNTKVIWTKSRFGELGRICLHGHTLAEVTNMGKVYLNTRTLENWPTRTMCSRLRALGFAVNVKDGQPFVNGEPLPPWRRAGHLYLTPERLAQQLA